MESFAKISYNLKQWIIFVVSPIIDVWQGLKWDKVFKNEPSKICGRQSLKNFTWSVLEYFVTNDTLVYVFRRSFRNTIKPSKHWSCCRRLEDVFRLGLHKTYSRLDILIKTNIFGLVVRLQDVLKTSSRRTIEDKLVFINMSSRHLQDVFKTFSRRLQNDFKIPPNVSLKENWPSTIFQHVLRRRTSRERFNLATLYEEFTVMIQIF